MEAPFSRRSIRFRMTAWYTLLLALVLLTLSFSLSTLLERRLRGDVDRELLATAGQVYGQLQPGFPDFQRVSVPNPSQLKSLASAGQFIQIVDLDNDVVAASTNLGDNVLPAAPVSPGDSLPVYHTGAINGSAIRTVRVPIIYNGRTIGAIEVGEPLLALNRTLALLRDLLIPIAIVALALAAVGGWLLAGRALRPVDRITATAAKIGAGAGAGAATSLATRLPVPDTADEVARLAATFNAMLDRIEAAFAAQQRFVADASHELRTPLTAVRGNVDVLLRQVRAERAGDAGMPGIAGDDAEAALADVVRETKRMGRLIDELLLLARADAPAAGMGTGTGAPDAEPVRLDLVAQEAVRTAAALASGQEIVLRADAPVLVAGDHDRLVQLLLILLDNALRHTPAGGRITVEVAPAGADRVRLGVADTGEGIAPEHLPHVFERFYRADTARTRATGGTGLGLAIATAIARAHGGSLAVASTPGVGSTFTLILPLLAAVPESASAAPPAPANVTFFPQQAEERRRRTEPSS